jgi:ABC-type Fe3+/spermidine/putrescine transport system ATPase subunit
VTGPGAGAPIASAGAPPILELRGLEKRFGDVVALDGISLVIEQGEFLTVLGASGSGKTTTLRLIAGFERPSGGAILMDGVDIASEPPYRRAINTVFQQYALFPHMSVRENVAYGLRMRGVAAGEIAARVDGALAMVRLEALGGRAPRQLSGGQQQRVALARALVNRPRLLLLDEPLGALDLKLRREMQVELKQLQTELGITFVYVTHDQEEALTMSDRIVLMRGGRIEQVGGPRELYDRPASRYVADFIGETNLLPVGDGEFLSVRPEVMLLGDVGVAGTVVDVSYAGSVSKVRVVLEDRTVVVVQQGAHRAVPAVGAAVCVSWPTEREVRVRG